LKGGGFSKPKSMEEKFIGSNLVLSIITIVLVLLLF
jgi:hypothetical protein